MLGALAVFLAGELAPDLDVHPLKLWGMAALGCTAIAWMILLGQTRRLLWLQERITGQDLDGDGETGPPRERVVFVNAPQAAQEAHQRQEHAEAGRFEQFIAGLAIHGTTQAYWERKLGRDTANEYRDALIQMGWARWRSVGGDGTPNRSQGWELVIEPKEILSRISS